MADQPGSSDTDQADGSYRKRAMRWITGTYNNIKSLLAQADICQENEDTTAISTSFFMTDADGNSSVVDSRTMSRPSRPRMAKSMRRSGSSLSNNTHAESRSLFYANSTFYQSAPQIDQSSYAPAASTSSVAAGQHQESLMSDSTIHTADKARSTNWILPDNINSADWSMDDGHAHLPPKEALPGVAADKAMIDQSEDAGLSLVTADCSAFSHANLQHELQQSQFYNAGQMGLERVAAADSSKTLDTQNSAKATNPKIIPGDVISGPEAGVQAPKSVHTSAEHCETTAPPAGLEIIDLSDEDQSMESEASSEPSKFVFKHDDYGESESVSGQSNDIEQASGSDVYSHYGSDEETQQGRDIGSLNYGSPGSQLSSIPYQKDFINARPEITHHSNKSKVNLAHTGPIDLDRNPFTEAVSWVNDFDDKDEQAYGSAELDDNDGVELENARDVRPAGLNEKTTASDNGCNLQHAELAALALQRLNQTDTVLYNLPSGGGAAVTRSGYCQLSGEQMSATENVQASHAPSAVKPDRPSSDLSFSAGSVPSPATRTGMTSFDFSFPVNSVPDVGFHLFSPEIKPTQPAQLEPPQSVLGEIAPEDNMPEALPGPLQESVGSQTTSTLTSPQELKVSPVAEPCSLKRGPLSDLGFEFAIAESKPKTQAKTPAATLRQQRKGPESMAEGRIADAENLVVQARRLISLSTVFHRRAAVLKSAVPIRDEAMIKSLREKISVSSLFGGQSSNQPAAATPATGSNEEVPSAAVESAKATAVSTTVEANGLSEKDTPTNSGVDTSRIISGSKRPHEQQSPSSRKKRHSAPSLPTTKRSSREENKSRSSRRSQRLQEKKSESKEDEEPKDLVVRRSRA